ncbi:hypothetical protein [Spirillospora sp. NPDC048819]|uniref:phosphatase domain-containing putative toxin n=1 Tax=Spirillospora sp. NPDC048819 TaxID=3155268 RepID=UPI00340DD382
MTALKTEGVDVLVCALTPTELDETGLTAEPLTAQQAGLRFVAISIPDRDVPDLAAVLPALQQLAQQLQSGAHIVTHCRFGIGRASLLAASLLILNATHPDSAWNHIHRARGLPVPDTAEQREWTNMLVKHRLA